MHRFLVLVGLVKDDPANLERLGDRRGYVVAATIIGVAVVVVLIKLAY